MLSVCVSCVSMLSLPLRFLGTPPCARAPTNLHANNYRSRTRAAPTCSRACESSQAPSPGLPAPQSGCPLETRSRAARGVGQHAARPACGTHSTAARWRACRRPCAAQPTQAPALYIHTPQVCALSTTTHTLARRRGDKAPAGKAPPLRCRWPPRPTTHTLPSLPARRCDCDCDGLSMWKPRVRCACAWRESGERSWLAPTVLL